MRIEKRKNLTRSQKKEILELWNNEYPKNIQYQNLRELDDYLNKLDDQNHILIIDEYDKIKGWYSDFIREKQRWFLAILDSEIQNRNFGTKILEMAKQNHNELNGWVIESDDYIKANGRTYKSPLLFYKKNGFKIDREIKLNSDGISAIKVHWCKNY